MTRFRKIKLVLNIGTIWTNASKLSSDSEFETYSNNTIAAVRGTIYGMTKDSTKTNVTLVRGEISVKSFVLDEEELLNQLEDGDTISSTAIDDYL
ncbi:MAG: hypothetical protein PHR68_04645 [Candidatus Gracilibacteria bacterium]|nr:hypothetical protein [Candidatus Gracilibacteria bacterium]